MKVLDNPFAIANEILQIIKESNEFVYLISPYSQFERGSFIKFTELKKIKDATIKSLKRNVDVNFITRSTDDYKKLKFMHEEGCKIYVVPQLHSKIYCNESKAIITSMNLYLFSILNNKEIGIVLTKKTELTEFNKIISYAIDLTKSSSKPPI